MSENTNTTSVLSINDTVLLALTETGFSASGYESVVSKAVQKLTEREQALTAAVIESAESTFGYGEQAQGLLEEAGLAITPKPEPVVEEAPESAAAEGTSVEDRLARMEGQIAALIAAANHAGLSV